MRTRLFETHTRVPHVSLESAPAGAPRVQLVLLSTLKPSRRNVRTHSKKQISQIANSIRAFGWSCPIIVDENSNIIGGHGRFEAAKLLGYRYVLVIVMSGLNDTQKRALALADNRIAAGAGYDRAALATELTELSVLLPELNLDLAITGFETAEFDLLCSDLGNPEADPSDDVAPPEEHAVSEAGDLWQLGQHRLLCGNSKDPNDFKKLMRREHAVMVFTDPPYNVKIKSVQGRGRTKHREFAFASGEMSERQFTAFLSTILGLIAQYTANGAIVFVCIDWRHIRELLDAGEEVFGALKNLITWVKTHAGMGSFYRSQYELIFVFKNGDAPHINNFELGQHGRNRSNVWTYAGVNTFHTGKLDDLGAHPTVKPVALVADAMKDCSRRGDIVLDPFMGSGTTILAAEKVGRRAYGIEIDPLYVDVAVRRWQAFTKRDATLKETGQTFDEVAETRTAAAPRQRVR